MFVLTVAADIQNSLTVSLKFKPSPDYYRAFYYLPWLKKYTEIASTILNCHNEIIISCAIYLRQLDPHGVERARLVRNFTIVYELVHCLANETFTDKCLLRKIDR